MRSRLESGGAPLATSHGTTVTNGGPVLVRGGHVRISQRRDGFVHPGDPSFAYGWFVKRNPRTIAGVDGQGRTVLVTVDGRSAEDLGLSVPEAARLARSLGMVDAINLDGGGSTTMVVDGSVISTPRTPPESGPSAMPWSSAPADRGITLPGRFASVTARHRGG